MKKALALILGIVMVLGLLAGCSGKEKGPVELTLQLWDEAQQPVIQENVDKFNAAHEGQIHVTIEQIPWGTYWTKLDASLETDEAPDVFWMNVYVHKYSEAGLLEPLDAYTSRRTISTPAFMPRAVWTPITWAACSMRFPRAWIRLWLR